MRDGVRGAFRNHKDELVHERLRVFDFDEPANFPPERRSAAMTALLLHLQSRLLRSNTDRRW